MSDLTGSCSPGSDGVTSLLCLQRVEDQRRCAHPRGVCHQHVLRGGVRDGSQQHRPLRLLRLALHRLPELRHLSGEINASWALKPLFPFN